MTSKITLKKSSVPGKVPIVTDLEYGEIALNYADGVLYYKTSSNVISALGSGIAGANTESTDTFNLLEYTSGSAEVLIQATLGAERHFTKLLVSHNSSAAFHTEFGTLVTDIPLFTVLVNKGISSIQIQVTPLTSSPTSFQARYTLMKG